jgi:D-alanine-D-alanine ligase
MQVLVLHEAVAKDAPPEAMDTLVQVETVAAALRGLGHEVESAAVTLDLGALEARLGRRRPDVVFNLVESLGGADALAIAPVALLETRGIPCTGSPSATLALCNHKPMAKALMCALGIPTPGWIVAGSSEAIPGTYVVKAVAEHASLGLDDDSVVSVQRAADLQAAIARHVRRTGRPCFAERYVAGREFNLGLIERADAMQCLPPAEIDFSGFAPGKPRLVGYAAKWQEDSIEYRQTPRRFDFAAADAALLRSLERHALQVCEAFGVRGYARVDFRVDEAGPWVLEVNTNPCLSPDAGFAAALGQARVDYAQAIADILAAALARR